MSSPYSRLLRNRNFALLLVGLGLSAVGDAFFDLALMWHVYQTSGSAVQAAGVIIAGQVAVVLLGPVAGTLVDRWDRRRTMIAVDLLRAAIVVAVAALAWAGRLAPAAAFVAVFALRVGSLFFRPARIAAMPDIAGPASLVAANGAPVRSWPSRCCACQIGRPTRERTLPAGGGVASRGMRQTGSAW